LLARAERDMPGAAAAYEQAVLLDPTDVVIRLAHAQSLFDAGRLDSAAAEVRRVIAAESMWASPYLLLARTLERGGKQAEARPEYERYLARTTRADPQARPIRTRLGIAQPPE
jgi:predicted Zn-dependent protease